MKIQRIALLSALLLATQAPAQTGVTVEAYYYCASILEQAAAVVEQPYRSVYLERAADLAAAALAIDAARWNELAAAPEPDYADMTRPEVVRAADFCLEHLEPAPD